MRGLKRFAAGLTTVTLAASASAFAAVSSDVDGTIYAEPIQVLSALNIMNGDGDGNYRPNDTIIRSEVTKMAVHILGLEDAAASSKGVSKFPDVPTDHWANGYINIATSQGIVVGDDEGNFRPNDKITYAEAMTILVRSIGYEKPAETKGGFPQGYLIVGSDNGISKNVAGTANKPVSRGEVAVMTKNALEAKIMELTGYGDEIKYEVTDKTLLFDKLNVTKHEGQITAIQDTSLDGGSNLLAGQVKIDNTVYNTTQNLNNLLGYNVEYYVKESDKSSDAVITAIPKAGKNSVISVNAKNFEGITTKNGNKALEYYKADSDLKASTVTLQQDAKLIYNGKYEEMSDELLNIKDKSGDIMLLDTDKNGKYDIVFVTEYKNIVVKEVTASGKIIDKYSGESIKLDNDDEDLRYTISRGYEELKPSDLKEYDVLSVAASKDEKLFRIIVNNNSVSGKVTGVDSDGVYIDGQHYEIAKNYNREITMGTESIFYLDIDGRIAATDSAGHERSNYAYLMKAYANMDTDEKANFKVYTRDGEEKILEATEKIRFNEKNGTLATDVVTQLNKNNTTEKQLITYNLNADGRLTSLNTAVDKTTTGEADNNSFAKNYVLQGAKYNETRHSLGNVRLNSNTVVFDIPAGSDDTSDYNITDMSMFEDEQSYDIIVYDRSDDYYAKAIIVTNAEFKVTADASIAVVSKIATATNAYDEITDRLYAYQDGKLITLDAQRKGILVKDSGNAVKNGDIIQYHTNSKGEIASIRVLFDSESKTTEATQTPAEKLSTMYGKVTKKFDKSINVRVNDDEDTNLQLPDGVVVYCVDTTKTKNNINVATINDIQVYDSEEGNRIFLKIYKDIVKEIVIVK